MRRICLVTLCLTLFAAGNAYAVEPPELTGMPQVDRELVIYYYVLTEIENGAAEAVHSEVERVVTVFVSYLEAGRRAEIARQNASRPRATTPGTTVGQCTGFSIPDYIIQRESGGNPSAYNPSGAYGCAQTLLSHYYGGSCSGLNPYTIEGQRECVRILSNNGTNLQPWAATR